MQVPSNQLEVLVCGSHKALTWHGSWSWCMSKINNSALQIQWT